MHPQSPTLTINRTVLKESDEIAILGVPFDYKMVFEKPVRSVSEQLHKDGILKKSCRLFHNRSLLLRCFRGFVLSFLEYFCVVWWSASDTTGPCSQWCHFFNWDVFESDIAHRRSVAVLCML